MINAEAALLSEKVLLRLFLKNMNMQKHVAQRFTARCAAMVLPVMPITSLHLIPMHAAVHRQ